MLNDDFTKKILKHRDDIVLLDETMHRLYNCCWHPRTKPLDYPVRYETPSTEVFRIFVVTAGPDDVLRLYINSGEYEQFKNVRELIAHLEAKRLMES
jgi:hypothetical protein